MKQVWLVSTAAVLAALASCGSGPPQETEQAQASAAAGTLVDPGKIARADLQSAVSNERVRAFYQSRDWRPAWTSDNVGQLLEVLRQADRHGLDPRSYIDPVDRAGTPAEREAALTRAALDLADALGDGKVDPGEIFSIYTLDRPQFDAAAGLGAAVESGNVGEWLAGLAPDDAEYRALSQAYRDYVRRASEDAGKGIEGGDLIHPGDSDPRVPRIAKVLGENGYLDEQQAGSDTLYSGRIADAIGRMQEDFGITSDGVVGPDTLEMLNTGSTERARMLAVNLERRRWLARNPSATRIDVNTAAATLAYYRDGTLRDRRKVIVGQPDWETPHLGSPIYRLVANPTWTVPKSIEEKELAGKGQAYLRRNNMVRRDGWIVQLPGPDNALGQVKFDMRNQYAIYLHDTPAKSLFDRNQRQLSHGCVRVENAEQFARILAEDAGVLSEYQAARASGEQRFVDLPRQIPVRLLYFTAFTDGSGEVQFRTDPYGWDDRVAEALGYERRSGLRRLQARVSDIGP